MRTYNILIAIPFSWEGTKEGFGAHRQIWAGTYLDFMLRAYLLFWQKFDALLTFTEMLEVNILFHHNM